MYCINCGVKLENGLEKCPLCNTVVPIPNPKTEEPAYPVNKRPKIKAKSKALSGALLIILFIPLILTFFADIHDNQKIDWFGYVAGALFVAYIILALPIWFRNPNPVIFIPCDFAATLPYLFYINWALDGNWFWSFALPICLVLALITSALITLLHYLKKGRLFIIGGFLIALGLFILLLEFLMSQTFQIVFSGWSIYPLVTFALFGGMLIFLAINRSARAMLERKLFF
jgi:hypothetical protein